ncbi:MAG: M24 family metallopeptidase [bacterium]
MKQPINRLNCLMNKLHLDAAVVVSKPNKLYLTGYEYEEGYLLIDHSCVKLFVDPRFSIYAKTHLSGVDVVESKQPLKDLRNNLKRYKRIGLDGSGLLHKDFLDITSKLAGQTFIFIQQHILKFRAIKRDDEVDYIKKASSIANSAIRRLLNKLTSGLTERQVAEILNLELANAGSDGPSFETVIAFDEHAAFAHAIPSSTTVLKDKKLLLCDFGAIYKGYHSDETHTFFINKMDNKSRRLYSAVLGAHDRAISAVRAGLKASELDRVAREFLDKQGYGKYFGHALGHGVGLEVHELPSISYRSKDVLEPGMIFTIEPGVYIPGWGGIRIESMIYISSRGKEHLTPRHKPVIKLEA